MALLVPGVFLLLLAVTAVSAVDNKCAACNAVAGELEIGLSNEKPRNHLDMRYRLDSKGQREGKVIDYRYCSPLYLFEFMEHYYYYVFLFDSLQIVIIL
ncbi:hypothetical protein LINPERPRIM_LOCUS32477 [Linum perenne]